jgi:hypothetical protein
MFFFRSLERVAPAHMVGEVRGGTLEDAHARTAEHVPVLEEKSEQRREVVNLHIAIHISGRETDRAASHPLGNHTEIVELQDRMRSGRRTAHRARATVGQNHRQCSEFRIADQPDTHPFHEA